MPSQYTEELQSLVNSLMNRTPDLRPSTSRVLHLPFIRQHISSFLKDTTTVNAKSKVEDHQGMTKSRKQNDDLQEHDCIPVVEEERAGHNVCRERKVKNNTEETECVNEESCLKVNSNAKRSCKLVSRELESLHIAGDKMKLGDRSAVEHKPQGSRECKCQRRDKQDLSTAGHVGSHSRERRRNSKKSSIKSVDHDANNFIVNEKVHYSTNPTRDEGPSAHHLSSARERRRQKKLPETKLDSCEISSHPSVYEDREDGVDANCTESYSNNSSVSQNNSSSEAVTHYVSDEDLYLHCGISWKSQEEDEFLHLLNTTLTSDDCELSGGEVKTSLDARLVAEAGASHEMEARISQLEEILTDQVGQVSLFSWFFIHM